MASPKIKHLVPRRKFADLHAIQGPCVVPDMSNAEYHAHPAHSSTQLKVALQSAAHYRSQVLDGNKKESKDLKLGAAFHARVLEPGVFSREFGVLPDKTRPEECPELAGKVLLSPSERAVVDRMADSLLSHKAARELLERGTAEHSVFFREPRTGEAGRCRWDWLNQAMGIVDLKSAKDASFEGFMRACAQYRYDLSAAWYVDGIRSVLGETYPFFLIAVEKTEPYAAAVYQVSEEMLAVGRARYLQALETIVQCRETNHWPGYQPDGRAQLISLPPWDTRPLPVYQPRLDAGRAGEAETRIRAVVDF